MLKQVAAVGKGKSDEQVIKFIVNGIGAPPMVVMALKPPRGVVVMPVANKRTSLFSSLGSEETRSQNQQTTSVVLEQLT